MKSAKLKLDIYCEFDEYYIKQKIQSSLIKYSRLFDMNDVDLFRMHRLCGRNFYQSFGMHDCEVTDKINGSV